MDNNKDMGTYCHGTFYSTTKILWLELNKVKRIPLLVEQNRFGHNFRFDIFFAHSTKTSQTFLSEIQPGFSV